MFASSRLRDRAELAGAFSIDERSARPTFVIVPPFNRFDPADDSLPICKRVVARGAKQLGRRRFRGSTEEEARAWLFGIARRRFAMYVRRGKAERRAVRRLGLERPQLHEGEYARIEQLAGLDAIRGTLAEHVSRLAPAQRTALELRVVRELPYPDVADRLGISEQAARARVSRALRALGSALDGLAATQR